MMIDAQSMSEEQSGKLTYQWMSVWIPKLPETYRSRINTHTTVSKARKIPRVAPMANHQHSPHRATDVYISSVYTDSRELDLELEL